MNRQQKAQVVDLLKDNFSNSQASFLVGFQGLTVAQMQGLRRELSKNGASLKVTKARLMKRAVGGLKGTEDLTPFFKGQVGLVFAPGDTAATAKVLHDYSKENESLKLLVGCVDQQLLDGTSIVRIASLPSKEVLLAQVCGTIKAPITSFVNILNIQILRLLWTLKQIEAKGNNSESSNA